MPRSPHWTLWLISNMLRFMLCNVSSCSPTAMLHSQSLLGQYGCSSQPAFRPSLCNLMCCMSVLALVRFGGISRVIEPARPTGFLMISRFSPGRAKSQCIRTLLRAFSKGGFSQESEFWQEICREGKVQSKQRCFVSKDYRTED